MNKRFKRLAKPIKDKTSSILYNLTRVVDVRDRYMMWSCNKYMVVSPTDLANGQYDPQTWKLNDSQGYSVSNWVEPYKEFAPSWMMCFTELRRLVRQASLMTCDNAKTARFNFDNSMALLTVSNSTRLGEYRGDAMTEPHAASDFSKDFDLQVINDWIGRVNKDEDQRIWIQNIGTSALGFKTFDGECLFISRSA